jgi:hypothetical protein
MFQPDELLHSLRTAKARLESGIFDTIDEELEIEYCNQLDMLLDKAEEEGYREDERIVEAAKDLTNVMYGLAFNDRNRTS